MTRILTAVIALYAAGQQLTVWDGVYTREQSDRGEKIYADRCAKCHGDTLQGIEAAPALVGPRFYSNWDGETLDALFERMRTSMPRIDPGRSPAPRMQTSSPTCSALAHSPPAR